MKKWPHLPQNVPFKLKRDNNHREIKGIVVLNQIPFLTSPVTFLLIKYASKN